MKKLLFSIIFSLLNISAFSQSWEWVKGYSLITDPQMTGVSQVATSVGTDKWGHIYFAGYATNHYSWGCKMLYKTDPQGNVLWADTLHPALNDIKVTEDGDIYVSGNWVLAKYNSYGQKLWLQNLQYAGIKSMALMSGGGVVVSGLNLEGHGPVFGSIALTGNSRFFMARCDANGNWLWAKEGNDYYATSLNILENVILGVKSAYPYAVTKFDENGNFIEGYLDDLYCYYSSNPDNHQPITPIDITTDKLGNFYLLLNNVHPLILSISGNNFYAYGDQTNSFLAKFNSEAEFQWIRHFKGNVTGQKILCDNERSVYVAGAGSNIEVDGNIFCQGRGGGFVVKFSSEGKFIWSKMSEPGNGSYYNMNFYGLALDYNNAVIVCGPVHGAIKFDDIQFQVGRYSDFCLAKINQSQSNSIKPTNNSSGHLEVFPNPSFNHLNLKIYLSEPDALSVKIRDISGKLIWSEKLPEFEGELNKKISLQHAPGVYFLEVTGNRERFVKKVIKN
jgi:hypothetical protein